MSTVGRLFRMRRWRFSHFFHIHIYFSVHIVAQKAALADFNVMLLCFWYSLLGVLTSFVSPVFETVTLPSTSWDWFLLTAHCLSSAAYAYTTTIAQDMASFIVTSLAFGFTVAFYFMAQYIVFQEISSGSGLAIEIIGAVLTVISSSLVPVYELVVQMLCKRNNGG